MASVSIVNLSEVKANGWRMDGEYWAGRAVSNAEYILLESFCEFVKKGIFDISPNNYVQKDGVPFIRSGDLNDELLNADGIIEINQVSHNSEIKTELGIGDLLVGKVGTIGNFAINYRFQKLNFSQNVVGIKIKQECKKSAAFLFAYLNGKYGQKIIVQSQSGNVQPKLTLDDIRLIKIPILSPTFQLKIESLVRGAHEALTSSKAAYKQAEKLLLDEVFGGWKPRAHKNWHVKMLSDAQAAERLDAEYFHPRFDELIARIEGYKGGCKTVGEVCEIRKGIEPGASEYKANGVQFIRIADLSKFGLSSESKFVSHEFYEANKKLQLQQGEILLSKDGTPGIAYYLSEKPVEMLCSGGILRCKVLSDFSPEVLTLLINSAIVQPQIDSEMSGAIIKHWLANQVNSTKLPLLPPPLQTQISALVKTSFEQQTRAKALLKLAKESVEIAIEKDEAAGLEEIQSKVKTL